MRAYSIDLRERIVAACAAGQRQAAVAKVYQVSLKTVGTFCRLAARGQLAPRPIPGRPPRLDAAQMESLGRLLAAQVDWNIESLRLEWARRSGVLLPPSTMHDALHRLDARYKKKSHRAGTQCGQASRLLAPSGDHSGGQVSLHR